MFQKLLCLMLVTTAVPAFSQHDTSNRLELGVNLSQLISTVAGNRTGNILEAISKIDILD